MKCAACAELEFQSYNPIYLLIHRKGAEDAKKIWVFVEQYRSLRLCGAN
jgi:hypothetical protein